MEVTSKYFSEIWTQYSPIYSGLSTKNKRKRSKVLVPILNESQVIFSPPLNNKISEINDLYIKGWTSDASERLFELWMGRRSAEAWNAPFLYG